MKILAVDSSAVAASAAVVENGNVLAEFFMNSKLTHSETLMPMVKDMLKAIKCSLDEIDLFAVSAGPGSFTGVRIGVAAVKGLAFGRNKPCAGVSTLEAMAYEYRGENTLLCAAMDARCQQVYNALFRCCEGSVERLCADRAIGIGDLSKELEGYSEPIVFMGDGAKLCVDKISGNNCLLAPEHRRYQRAFGVAMAAQHSFESGKMVTDSQLVPIYLRLSQAERERKKINNH